MTSLERLVPLAPVGRAADALLAEADRLHLVARLGHDDVAFGRVARSLLRLVVAGNTCAGESGILFHGLLLVEEFDRLGGLCSIDAERLRTVRGNGQRAA